jgi:NAD(P)-dependent dehydrogenase (short-subunit alcohol dehydrogenase family)
MKQSNYGGALQQPIGSGFDAWSTTSDVIAGIDLSGKLVIITGGHTGIGLETTKTLVGAGAKVIVLARDIEKARKNLDGISNVELEALDMMDPNSIERFTTRFLASDRPLHLLINNAGIMWVPLRRDSRGNESQLSTNYLGQFHLTALLWPALQKANGARVINVSSFGHQMAPFDFDDPNFERREYNTLQGYGQSKTAVNLFSLELDHIGQPHQINAYAVHPGAVLGTDLGREEPIEMFIAMGTHDANGQLKPEVASTLKTISQGAATPVWCATSPKLNDIGGVYCENADIAELDRGNIEHKYDDPVTLRGVQPYSLDRTNAKRLWAWSEQMIGKKFS